MADDARRLPLVLWTARCRHCGRPFQTASLADKTCSDGCYDAWLTSLEVPGPSLPYIRSMHNRMRRERGIPERTDGRTD
jgi:hypothetical protein